MFDAAVHWLTETIFALGYPGIVLLMAIESSFFPLPSELVMPPAGYLAAQGRMDLTLAVLAGAFGSLLGALFNYYFAVYLGEPFLRRYGRYFFVSNESLDRAEAFFRRHGEIGTFVGRFVPVVRHLISIPAGLARMQLGRFAFFTTLGAGIWCAVLAYIGWLLGRHEGALRDAAVNTHTTRALLYILPALVVILAAYTLWYRRRQGRGDRVA
jgi:membrane protein DedA with SNARE-associated domain